MATRAELLAEFTQYSDETLTKLLTIADSIMSPLDTELTSVDFASMVAQVFRDNGLAQRYFPAWQDKSVSDFGRFLVEIFAIFSDKDMFYINHYSDEAFIGKANLYRSIFHKAFHEGFNPPTNVSASGDVELIFASGAIENVPRGAITLGVSSVNSAVYTNDAFTTPASSIDTPVTVTFRHGRLRQEQGFFDGYSIRLSNSNTTQDSIELTIDGDIWTQVTSFLNSTSSDKHYMAVSDETGTPELLFGKNGYGAVPKVGVLWQTEAIIGGGYIGDIAANTMDIVVNSGTIRNLKSFTQFEMAGGNIQMPMEILRSTVVGKRRAQNRVVTPQDASYFVSQLEFAVKVNAESFQDYLYVYVLPTGSGNLSPSQISLIEGVLLPSDPILLMGFHLTVASPIYVPVKIHVDLYLTPKTPRAGAMTVATQTLQEYLDPQLQGGFGIGVIRSAMSSLLIGAVKGSTNAVFNIVQRGGSTDPSSDLDFISQEVVDYAGSEIIINLIGGM